MNNSDSNEQQRLAALAALQIMDTPSEQAFDDLPFADDSFDVVVGDAFAAWWEALHAEEPPQSDESSSS